MIYAVRRKREIGSRSVNMWNEIFTVLKAKISFFIIFKSFAKTTEKRERFLKGDKVSEIFTKI